MRLATARLAPAFLAAALLGACTPMQWVKEGTALEDFDRDIVQCRAQAWREARMRSAFHRPVTPMMSRDAQGRPFVYYAPSYQDPFSDPFLEESRLAQFCMHAKGYRLEPIEQKK
jgi:hypothetical protein